MPRLNKLDFYCIEDGHQDLLLKPGEDVRFPLTEEVKKFVSDLKYTYENTENCAGLAACQVGKPLRLFIAGLSEGAKEHRENVIGTLPVTVFYNPFYEGIGNEKVADWEGCFSVRDTIGQVYRFKHIKFRYQNEKGEFIEKEYEGFIARLLQHETDHTNGILCNSKYAPDKPHGTYEEIKDFRNKNKTEKLN